MRLRLPYAVSALAIAAVALAGCASSAPEASPSSSVAPSGAATDPAAADSLCASPLPTGAASDAVQVTGEVGSAPTATFTAPLDIADLQRTVVTTGDGVVAKPGDYVSYALTAYDAATGEKLGEQGYTEGEILPQPALAGQTLGQLVSCEPVGSRSVIAFPTSGQTQAMVYVFDFLGVTPLKAWGTDEPAVEGMPTVTLAEDGQPTITVPQTDAPTTTQVAVLKQGDGAEVQPGDTVLLQYYGVKWSDGTSFDSSWSRGAPTSFPTNQVIAGFTKALEGHAVGSQVIAVVTPEDGYGAAEGNALQKETLVFVVDILATSHAPAQ